LAGSASLHILANYNLPLNRALYELEDWLMIRIIVTILGLFLFGCTSTDNEDDPFNNISNEAPKTHQDKLGGKEAAVGVALAATLGVINRNKFECNKDCEDALKESLANANKYK